MIASLLFSKAGIIVIGIMCVALFGGWKALKWKLKRDGKKEAYQDVKNQSQEQRIESTEKADMQQAEMSGMSTDTLRKRVFDNISRARRRLSKRD